MRIVPSSVSLRYENQMQPSLDFVRISVGTWDGFIHRAIPRKLFHEQCASEQMMKARKQAADRPRARSDDLNDGRTLPRTVTEYSACP